MPNLFDAHKMQQSRLSHLPADLINLLARRLYWRDLQTSIMTRPEFVRYRNPDHPIWRELYQRDLSSYPLPNSSNYQEQYFRGHELVESLELQPLESQIEQLTERGYDVALTDLLAGKLVVGINLTHAIDSAAIGGYLNIVKLLDDLTPPAERDSVEFALRRAAANNYLDVVEYLMRTRSPTIIHHGIPAAIWAAKKGQSDMVELIYGFIRHYYPLNASLNIRHEILIGALQSDNLDLVRWLWYPLDDTPQELLVEMSNFTPHFTIANHIVKQLPLAEQPDYYPLLVQAAASDCLVDQLEELQQQQGANLDPAVKIVMENCPDLDILKRLMELNPVSNEVIVSLLRAQQAKLLTPEQQERATYYNPTFRHILLSDVSFGSREISSSSDSDEEYIQT